MILDIQEKHVLTVNKWLCYKARTKALAILIENLDGFYAKLGSYIAELKEIDGEGKFELQTEAIGANGGPVFKRLYIGFSSLRKGYLVRCKPCICLDRCFLKTGMGRALFCGVDRDRNNQMFPISWYVVEGKNEDSWRWYLTILFEDLNIIDRFGLTLVSYQPKVNQYQ